MKRKREIVSLGDIGGAPLESDFEALKKAQAEQWAREKAAGSGESGALDDAEFMTLEEFKEKIRPERKKPVSIRFDADVLEWVKSGGKGYQTTLNAILRQLKEGRLELVEAAGKEARSGTPWPPLPRKRRKGAAA